MAQTITAREWMLAGPAETGKTWATVWRLDSLLRDTPKAQGALIRKGRVTIGPTVLVTYQRIQALREALGEKPAIPYGGNNPAWYDYPHNGARMWIGGMDDPGKVLSGERDFIYVNQAEELQSGDWETLSTRATGRGAVTKTPMLFGDCNPGPADHWIMRRKSLERLRSTHRDNPSLFDDDGNLTEQGVRTMAALDALTGVYRKRLRDGLWVGAEGQFFEWWDDDLHTCEPFRIPDDWYVWGAFDYGFVHNTSFGVYAQGNDGEIYKAGEHVANKLLPAQHVGAMDALLDRLGMGRERLRTIQAGHDVFQRRGDSQGKTIAEQYADLGYVFEPASIDRINGAAEMLGRLGNPTATPPLPATFKVFTTCPRTIATIPAMVHDPRRPEDVLKTDSEADGSGGDDAYDETRYGLMFAPLSVAATYGHNPLSGYRG